MRPLVRRRNARPDHRRHRAGNVPIHDDASRWQRRGGNDPADRLAQSGAWSVDPGRSIDRLQRPGRQGSVERWPVSRLRLTWSTSVASRRSWKAGIRPSHSVSRPTARGSSSSPIPDRTATSRTPATCTSSMPMAMACAASARSGPGWVTSTCRSSACRPTVARRCSGWTTRCGSSTSLAAKLDGSPRTGFVSAVSWSPTGGWITYSRFHGKTSVVALVRPDGTDQHEISARDETDEANGSAWSPDGKYLLVPVTATAPSMAHRTSGSWTWGHIPRPGHASAIEVRHVQLGAQESVMTRSVVAMASIVMIVAGCIGGGPTASVAPTSPAAAASRPRPHRWPPPRRRSPIDSHSCDCACRADPVLSSGPRSRTLLHGQHRRHERTGALHEGRLRLCRLVSRRVTRPHRRRHGAGHVVTHDDKPDGSDTVTFPPRSRR